MKGNTQSSAISLKIPFFIPLPSHTTVLPHLSSSEQHLDIHAYMDVLATSSNSKFHETFVHIICFIIFL